MIFLRKFLTVGGRENVSAAGSEFVAAGRARILRIDQKLKFFVSRVNFE